MELTVRELLEIAIDEQVEFSYSIRPAVVGLEDIEKDYRPLYPVTVYQLSGDDTSGIAGLLFPSGEFRPVPTPRTIADYWEFDETLKYEQVPGELTPEGTPRVVGNSWTTGEVHWDGCAGVITNHVEMVTDIEVSSVQQTKGTLFVKSIKAKVIPHVRKKDINSLTGEWASHHPGGLRDMRQPGKLHLAHIATPEEGGANKAA